MCRIGRYGAHGARYRECDERRLLKLLKNIHKPLQRCWIKELLWAEPIAQIANRGGDALNDSWCFVMRLKRAADEGAQPRSLNHLLFVCLRDGEVRQCVPAVCCYRVRHSV